MQTLQIEKVISEENRLLNTFQKYHKLQHKPKSNTKRPSLNYSRIPLAIHRSLMDTKSEINQKHIDELHHKSPTINKVISKCRDRINSYTSTHKNYSLSATM